MVTIHCDKCQVLIASVPTSEAKVEMGAQFKAGYVTVFFGRMPELTARDLSIESVPGRGMRIFCGPCKEKYEAALQEF